LDALLLFALIVFLPFVMFFIFIFPEQFTELLIFFYNPDTRVAFIAAVLLLYLWLKYRKKHKKKKYDYLEDLSLIEGHVNGEFYHYRSLIDAKKGANFTLFVDGKCGYDFMLKFENGFEKFLKKISLAYECQSGDRRFDDTIYILSDDEVLCQDLQENAVLREAIFELFWSLKEKNYRVKFLRYYDGRLIMLADYKGEIDDSTYKEIETLSKQSASLMQKIIERLPNKVKKDEIIYRERTSWAINVITALFVALLLNGLIKLWLDMLDSFFLPRLVEKYAFFVPSIEIVALFLALYSLFSFFYFYKSSRLALALFIGFTLGGFGVFLSVITGLKEINLYLDDSKTYKRVERVVGKHLRRGRRSSVWYVDFSKLGEIRVPPSFYHKVDKGDWVWMEMKKGYLGVPWIYNIKNLKGEEND
jgi:hypothetical protein